MTLFLRLLVTMSVNNVIGNALVDLSVAFVQDHEEQIKTTHQWCGNGDILSQTLTSVISTSDGIGSSQDGGSCIQGSRDTCLGDGDCLLFHGFVDSHLVGIFHFIEFINTANAIIA